MANQEYQESKEIEVKKETAQHLEQLSYAVKSVDGQLILKELEGMLDGLRNSLYIVSMQQLKFPYQYSKEDLHKMMILRGQISQMDIIIEHLDNEKLLEKALTLKEQIVELEAGNPIEATY